jgi:hypothetical protein
MPVTPKSSLINWFKRGLKPLESQFAAWLDAYFHKDESIPQASVENLVSDLGNRVTSAQLASQKGVANGLASLDSGGKVPSAQLPSYVDDVLEYANLAAFPGTGETGKIYVATDTNLSYRWSGSAYVLISSVPADASPSVKGIAKIYSDVTAKNTDGSVHQSALVDGLQNASVISATATGTNIYAATIAPAITAYAANQRFFIKFTNGNTGNVTININTRGARSIKKNAIDELAPGDIVAGQVVEIVYDGTNFQAIGLTKVLETTLNNLAQDEITLSIYKSSNFATP